MGFFGIVFFCYLCYTLIYGVIQLSIGLTKIYMNKDGCLIVRGKRRKFHSWKDLNTIRHERYKYTRRMAKSLANEAIYFSTRKTLKKESKYPDEYLIFRNKLNNFYVSIPTINQLAKYGIDYDSLVYEKEEFLRTIGEWGVKIESQYEDMSVYLKEKKDEPITLKDGIYVKKDRLNEWIVVTEIMQHYIMYQPENKSLYVDGIKRVIKEESFVKLMGIDEEIKLDGKKLHLIIKNNVLRIVYKGKYVDIDEPYIPLKAERLIYFCVPIPVMIAIYAAMSKTHALFAVSFALIIVLAIYLKREIKKII